MALKNRNKQSGLIATEQPKLINRIYTMLPNEAMRDSKPISKHRNSMNFAEGDMKTPTPDSITVKTSTLRKKKKNKSLMFVNKTSKTLRPRAKSANINASETKIRSKSQPRKAKKSIAEISMDGSSTSASKPTSRKSSLNNDSFATTSNSIKTCSNEEIGEDTLHNTYENFLEDDILNCSTTSTQNASNTSLPNQPSKKNSKKLNVFKNSSILSLSDKENRQDNFSDSQLSSDSEVESESSRFSRGTTSHSSSQTRFSQGKGFAKSKTKIRSKSGQPKAQHSLRRSKLEGSKSVPQNEKTVDYVTKRKRSESLSVLAKSAKEPRLNRLSNVLANLNYHRIRQKQISDLLDISSKKPCRSVEKIRKSLDSSVTCNKTSKQSTSNNTPKKVKFPNNDLSNNNKSSKKLLFTSEKQKVPESPNNTLRNVAGAEKVFATPKLHKSPRNVGGVKRKFATPKTQNSPENDLSNVEGLKTMFKILNKIAIPLKSLLEIHTQINESYLNKA